jgi:hypothetical protein
MKKVNIIYAIIGFMIAVVLMPPVVFSILYINRAGCRWIETPLELPGWSVIDPDKDNPIWCPENR